MSLKIIEQAEAVRDAIAASDHVAAYSSLNASDKFSEAVKSAYRQIADMLNIGTLRDYGRSELKGMRMWRIPKYPKYLVFYYATGSELYILRVLHGSQDIAAIFRAPGE